MQNAKERHITQVQVVIKKNGGEKGTRHSDILTFRPSDTGTLMNLAVKLYIEVGVQYRHVLMLSHFVILTRAAS